jgi:hypothetical protein
VLAISNDHRHFPGKMTLMSRSWRRNEVVHPTDDVS